PRAAGSVSGHPRPGALPPRAAARARECAGPRVSGNARGGPGGAILPDDRVSAQPRTSTTTLARGPDARSTGGRSGVVARTRPEGWDGGLRLDTAIPGRARLPARRYSSQGRPDQHARLAGDPGPPARSRADGIRRDHADRAQVSERRGQGDSQASHGPRPARGYGEPTKDGLRGAPGRVASEGSW